LYTRRKTGAEEGNDITKGPVGILREANRAEMVMKVEIISFYQKTICANKTILRGKAARGLEKGKGDERGIGCNHPPEKRREKSITQLVMASVREWRDGRRWRGRKGKEGERKVASTT